MKIRFEKLDENYRKDNIGTALKMLEDEKPTAVRQSIAAFYEIAEYKPDLRGILKEELHALDYMKYGDSMQELIKKDAEELILFVDGLKFQNKGKYK